MAKSITRSFCFCLILLPFGCGSGKSTTEWIDQLQSRDASLRIHAIKALEEKTAEAGVVVPALARALKDSDPFVRRDAALALGRFEGDARPAFADLVFLREDPNGNVRKAADLALKKIDPQAATRAGVK